MPASIPDRYSLEVRLGRDGDLEEWLATDTSLDRPVLIRSLGPESTAERRQQFVSSVSDAAKTSHAHLARVFTVATVPGGAYAVSEWTGGATVADRVSADHPIDLPDFLPNAAGLAGALAALHGTGAVHGNIDPSAISYSGAHLAKLGAFGRPPLTDAEGDVRALSAALETALTGAPPGGPPPSERVDGVPRTIDVILRSGQSGDLTAADLEKALRAAPTPRPPQPESGSVPKRLLITAVGLVLMAVALVVVGFFLSGGTAVVLPTPTSRPDNSTTTTTMVTTTAAPGNVTVLEVATLDPFGEGGESDQLVENLIDGDSGTEWVTETYLDPLPLLKPGVGVTVQVQGTPDRIELVELSTDTDFEIRWSSSRTDVITDWERIAGGTAAPASTSIELPPRQNGYWLVWLTDLPPVEDGNFRAGLAELRFSP